MRRQIKSIPKRAMEMMTNCPWKGNIRELANLIERAVILTRGEELEVPLRDSPPHSRAMLLSECPPRFGKQNPL